MNKKNTKRSLLLSVLSLLMCCSMLIGSTFAWFTDSATSGSNVIQSGTLDIVLEYWDGAEWVDAEGKVLEFVKANTSAGTEVLWEPGCTYQLPKFRVRNEGNLNSKILLKLNGVTGDEKLMEAIEFKTTLTNIPETLLQGSAGHVFNQFVNKPLDLIYGTPDGTIIFDHALMGKGAVSPHTGHTDTSPEFTITGHMKEEAGNEYQGLTIEGVSITVLATQGVYEYDSFNREYDKNATFPVIVNNYDDLYSSVWYGDEVTISENLEMSQCAVAYGDANSVLNIGKGTILTVTPNKNSYSNTAFVATNGAKLTINNKGTLDLNYTESEKESFCAPFLATTSGTITVNGGTYLLGMCKNKYHIYSQNSGKVIINDGRFITSNPNAAIAYCINGYIEINGGYFENTANPNKALLDMGNNLNYINNQKITISGGTFVNWNPMDSAFARPWTNPDVPALIVLADGCEVVEQSQANGDIWYTVIRK